MRITINDFKNRGIVCGFFMFVFSIFACACQTANHTQPLSPQISGLYIGMPEIDLIDKFGKPVETDISPSGDYAEFSYDGLTVTLMASGPNLKSSKVIAGLWSKNPTYCYADIICPTMGLASIQTILGPADIEPATRDKPDRVKYSIRELETCWLWIYLNADRTASDIRLACQP